MYSHIFKYYYFRQIPLKSFTFPIFFRQNVFLFILFSIFYLIKNDIIFGHSISWLLSSRWPIIIISLPYSCSIMSYCKIFFIIFVLLFKYIFFIICMTIIIIYKLSYISPSLTLVKPSSFVLITFSSLPLSPRTMRDEVGASNIGTDEMKVSKRSQ